MDDGRFDRLAKTVAGTSSRRRLLRRALAAAPLAVGVTALRGQQPVAAAKQRAQAQGQGNTCKGNGQICGEVIGGACCHPLTCTTGPVGVSSCQLACNNDNECRHLYPSFQTSCQPDALACPFIKGGKCCTRQFCLSDAQCQHPFTCQGGLCRK